MSTFTAALPKPVKESTAETQSGLALKIAQLVKWPINIYHDCHCGVNGIGMLVQEANEHATKPWHQRLPED